MRKLFAGVRRLFHSPPKNWPASSFPAFEWPGFPGSRSCTAARALWLAPLILRRIFVVSAIVGVAGLEATHAAILTGKPVGLANKECMVAAGEILTAAARDHNVPILPIDSEHNAVHQCSSGWCALFAEVKAIWLTGVRRAWPFQRELPLDQFAK